MTIAQQITQEATAVNSDVDHPLPLVALWGVANQWDASNSGYGYAPIWQMQQIVSGHHLLPGFQGPDRGGEPDGMLCATEECVNNGSLLWPSYYQSAIQDAAAANLPLTFLFSQPESELYLNSAYFNLPYADNPNAWVNGGPVAKLSPFGAIAAWQAIGTSWAVSPMRTQLEEWYPTPPKMFYVLNNEASHLSWTEAETDQHYLDLYGAGQTDAFKRQKFAEGWTILYRALQQAWKDGITNPAWKNIVFIGYEAMGQRAFGRWGGWTDYSLYYPSNIAPETYPWDGGSPSYYLWDSVGPGPITDYTVWSPQVETMNYPFMFPEIYAVNSAFWFELSTWNGANPAGTTNYAQRLIGQTYTPDRYAGMVQFGMWMTRPRVVRIFNPAPKSYSELFTEAIIAVVDKVYSDSVLMSFWRNSTLVTNDRPHPYQEAIPTEFQSSVRMFMLATNIDPPLPWTLTTEIPVYAMARVQGNAPQRKWLVYAFSPRGDQSVAVTIPTFGSVTLIATVAGSFTVVDESVIIPPLQITAPTNLRAVANSATQITLSWSPSAGSVGDYQVESSAGVKVANFVPIATVTNTIYVNTGLARNTYYSFRVRAIDINGNPSTYSAVVGIKTRSH